MPQKSKRRSQSAAAIRSRWAKKNIDQADDVFNPEISINVLDIDEDKKEKDILKNKISILDIGNLFEIIRQETSLRSLSVLLHLSLMYFDIPWRKIDSFLKDIGGLSAESCNKWSRILIEEDLEEFLEDNRGGKHGESFFDIYPELEILAKLYAVEACKRKAASFTCSELAKHLDEQYYKLTGEVRIAFIRFFYTFHICRSKIRKNLFDRKEPVILIYIGGVANSIRILLSLTGKVMKDRMLFKLAQNSLKIF
jgi:hypothetical protein